MNIFWRKVYSCSCMVVCVWVSYLFINHKYTCKDRWKWSVLRSVSLKVLKFCTLSSWRVNNVRKIIPYCLLYTKMEHKMILGISTASKKKETHSQQEKRSSGISFSFPSSQWVKFQFTILSVVHPFYLNFFSVLFPCQFTWDSGLLGQVNERERKF